MNLCLEKHERSLLAELLEVEHKNKRHELHRTATAAYRQRLRAEIEIIEELRAKLAAAEVSPAT